MLFLLGAFLRLRGFDFDIAVWCACSFGSPFMKPSAWFSNMPWLRDLPPGCTCSWSGKHFPVRNWDFTAASLSEFVDRCGGDVLSVYDRAPVIGERVSVYSGQYPRRAMDWIAERAV